MPAQLRKIVIAAAALSALGSAARAADYVTIPLETSVDAPADVAWKKIGGYCDIGAWMKTSCVITSGKDNEVGAVRRIADRVDEVLGLAHRLVLHLRPAQVADRLPRHGGDPAGRREEVIEDSLHPDL